jgi:hypothetical protein
VQYRIVWTENGGKQEKTVEGAAVADTWIGELRGKGVEGVEVFRGDERIDAAEVAHLVNTEAASSRDTAES